MRHTGEQVTRSTVSDLVGPAGTVAVVRLDAPDGRPLTLGPLGLAGLHEVLAAQRARAAAGAIQALVITGRPDQLCAGADLVALGGIADREQALAFARLGHDTLRLLGELGVPSLAAIGGVALGGGLELALHCTYRTVAAGARAIGLPETLLGLVPGWGGCTLLPRLVGVSEACRLIVDHPLSGNRLTDAATATRIGLVDAVVPDQRLVEASLEWLHEVLAGRVAVPRRPLDDSATWVTEVEAARERVRRRVGPAALAPYRALDLIAAARDLERDAAFVAEDQALADLIDTDQLRAGLHAFQLTTRGSKTPAGAPDPALARPVRTVGIAGAGLMAAQLGVLLATRLGVPVRMREIDEERAAAGRDRVTALLDGQVRRGRLSAEGAAEVAARIQVGTALTDLAGADLVIEAVTEVLAVKAAVFAELEGVVGPQCVLATNTSALSVTAMAAGLEHPERVVGLHVFNPVDRLPLAELVRAERTDDATLATAVAVARAAGRTVVLTADRPGFVVNRLLLRELAEVLHAVETGTPVAVADAALERLGLPMGPFALLQLVGLPVAEHVLTTLHDGLGERYRLSPGLHALAAAGRRVVGAPGTSAQDAVDPAIQEVFGPPGGPDALDRDQVADAVLRALTEEVGLLLAEGVVHAPDQVDLALLTGAGFPFHLGGLLPYLDAAGWSRRVLGRPLLTG